MHEKIEAHKAFWRGEGPCLILIPCGETAPPDLDDYEQRFREPAAMWEGQMREAQPLADWPTDGIPTVRPNLGVVFVPSMAGLQYRLQPGQLPWPGPHLGRDQVRAARDADVTEAELMGLAAEFYALHRARGSGRVAAYLPDTQGVFDIAHLLYGDALLYEMADEREAVWVEELMEICLDLYVRATCHLKGLLGEERTSMIHGHGSPQGVYFPGAGVRVAEDTATLVSPQMIERFILGQIQRSCARFGGGFAHYCGRHEALFGLLCGCDEVRAIDLGNPEAYELPGLLERCAETGTVLHSRVAAQPGEEWEAYLRRIATVVRDTGARCILRAEVTPSTREECAEIQEMWHDLTA